MQNGAREYVWYGETSRQEKTSGSTSGNGYASFKQTANGVLFGSFSTKNKAYGVDTLPDGSIVVRSARWEDIYDDQDDTTLGGGLDGRSLKDNASNFTKKQVPLITSIP